MNNFQSTNLNNFNNSRFKGKGLGGSPFLLSKLVKNIAISFLLVMLSVAGIVGGFSLIPNGSNSNTSQVENIDKLDAVEADIRITFYCATGVSISGSVHPTSGGNDSTFSVSSGSSTTRWFKYEWEDGDEIWYGAEDHITLTANVSNGYKWEGWYTGANGTGDFLGKSNPIAFYCASTYNENNNFYAYVTKAPNYNVSVGIRKNNSNWSSSGINLQLKQNGTVKYSASNITAASRSFNVVYGTYDLFASKSSSAKTTYVDTGIDVSSSSASPSVNYYVLTLNKGTGISRVSGAGTYLSNQSPTISASASTGYTFSNWTKTAGNTPLSTTSSSTTVSMSAATTLTANATANTFTIAFNANGGSGSTASVTATYNATSALTSNGFTRAGYTFAGWATSSTGSVAYSNGATLTAAQVNSMYSTAGKGGTYNLYAIWTQNDVTFPKIWDSELNNSTYMGSNTISPSTITSIKFRTSATSGYSKKGALSTGIEVYASGTNVEFVWAKTIYAPAESRCLFMESSASRIICDNFN